MTTITTVPTFTGPAPTRADPTTFSARGDVLMTELVAFVPAINTSIGQINTVAGEVATNAATVATSLSTASNAASTATAQAVIATTQAGNSSTSATAAAGSATSASGSATAAASSATSAAASAASITAPTVTSEGALINGATAKTTPVDADYIGLMDSAASNVLKKLSWANIKATLKTYFDTLYGAIAGSSSIVTTGTVTAGTWSSALAGETYSVNNGIIAGTNAQGQGAMTTDVNVITTAAASPSGVTLPTATAGRKIVVVNKGANTVNVYPATSGNIDALATNGAIALPVSGWIEFEAVSTNQWYSSANSSFGAGLLALAGNLTTSGAFATTISVTGTTGVTLPTSGTLISTAPSTSGNVLTSNGSAWTSAAPASSMPRGYINGFGLSNDGTTPNTKLDIAAGAAIDSTNAISITGTAFVKSTAGTWVAGTGNNGMGTGLTIANSTWYHVFAIINAGAFDVYFDTSPTAANKPASTTAFRYIGSFKTNGSANILTFRQSGQHFRWSAAINELSSGAGTGTDVVLAGIPTGFVCDALINGYMTGAILSGDSASFYEAGSTNYFVGSIVQNSSTVNQTKFQFTVTADTAATIRYANSTGSAGRTNIDTVGYVNPHVAGVY